MRRLLFRVGVAFAIGSATAVAISVVWSMKQARDDRRWRIE